METKEIKEKKKSAHMNIALGTFVLFFGVVILIAIFFTGTAQGKVTNAAAGLVLTAIGAQMIIKSKRTIKKLG